MRTAVRVMSIALILTGIGLGSGEFLQNWQADNEYRNTQQVLREDLRKANPAPREGDAHSVLRIPRFGSGYEPVVLEGISEETLTKGPGHFPESALPGEIGNFVVAGHRTGWGQPFRRLEELKEGDAIKVSWRGSDYVYHVTRTKVVKPSDTGVTLPVPGKPDAKADRARITLITCADRGWNGTYTHRFVVWGELDDSLESRGTTRLGQR